MRWTVVREIGVTIALAAIEAALTAAAAAVKARR
jgi:hypothetical protein